MITPWVGFDIGIGVSVSLAKVGVRFHRTLGFCGNKTSPTPSLSIWSDFSHSENLPIIPSYHGIPRHAFSAELGSLACSLCRAMSGFGLNCEPLRRRTRRASLNLVSAEQRANGSRLDGSLTTEWTVVHYVAGKYCIHSWVSLLEVMDDPMHRFRMCFRWLLPGS
jgi:hypothetical protein